MTPKERVSAVVNGKVPDRVPVFAGMALNTCQVLGYSMSEIRVDPKKAVEVIIAAQRLYDYDGIESVASRKMILEQFGCKVKKPKDGLLYIEEPGIKDYASLGKMNTPDPYDGEYLAYYLEVVRLLKRKVGNKLSVWGSTFGPFSLAGEARGIQNFLMDLYREPEYCHKLLQMATEFSIEFGRACLGAGAINICITDPLASSSVVSPGHFEEFAFRYLARLTSALVDDGALHFHIHICGNISPILEKVAEIPGIKILSLDSKVDLAEAKSRVGNKVAIRGNVNSVDTMYLGSVEDVRRESIKCIKKAAQGGGFILSPGCAVPLGTSPANVHALVETAKKYGKYPLSL